MGVGGSHGHWDGHLCISCIQSQIGELTCPSEATGVLSADRSDKPDVPGDDVGIRSDLAVRLVGHVGQFHRNAGRCVDGAGASISWLDVKCRCFLHIEDLVDR